MPPTIAAVGGPLTSRQRANRVAFARLLVIIHRSTVGRPTADARATSINLEPGDCTSPATAVSEDEADH